ncbi:MAG: ESPR-type extended signal peptide-containing protein [Pseudohongiella sp.]|nr:ESPR-type extended signal peptide-containing protein [Pseudohongiella sp.]
MNHVFRLVFNHSRKCWSVVPEQAVARGKKASAGSGRRAARVASLAVIGVFGTALSSDALAECKTPQQWLAGASTYFTPASLLPPGIASMSRTQFAGYNIDWRGTTGARGQPGQNMPSAWMDHYCESNPPVPQSQDLSVFIQGGKGGNGVQDTGNGGDGGRGGDGGDIFLGVLENNGVIATTANGRNALNAVSRGGDGAVGGSAGAFGTRGGSGGNGGNGGVVSLLNVGTLRTSGADADAIYGLSEGGTGERGGNGSWIPWSSAGTGGGGGNSGSKVMATNLGTLSTSGISSDGIHIRSVGGNGGTGGMRINTGTGSVAIGGDGGNGGNGGDVRVLNKGAVTTVGDHADAVSIQSVGGGGGDGGKAISAGAFSSVAIGGSGGGGGSAGIVEVVNENGNIRTTGRDAMGIRAQSIGGGGGNGGNAIAASAGVYVSSSTALGGSGGSGGNGALVRIASFGQSSIVTGADLGERFRTAVDIARVDPLAAARYNYATGIGAHGIFAQSVGGGGGSGGSAIALSAAVGDTFALAVSTALGGKGGEGGNGGEVQVINSDATIATYDRYSHGILAQSVGGGGGSGGDTISVAAAGSGGTSGSVNVAMGGTGGRGGSGNTVMVETGIALTTFGAGSHAVLAQSIGGGGGNGGSTLDVGVGIGTNALALGVKLGGTGGSGNSGGTVQINPNATSPKRTTITTHGDVANGILAQSIGGGGGVGGAVNSFAVGLQYGEGVAATSAFNLGGSGGTGGKGGTVSVNYDGRMNVWGNLSSGILSQSVGGGGGSGGNVSSVSVALSLNPNVGTGTGKDAVSDKGGAINATVNMGGSGGSGNEGGQVQTRLGSNSNISVHGIMSSGVFAQSIGGGGGNGGDARGWSVAGSMFPGSALTDNMAYKVFQQIAGIVSKKPGDSEKSQNSLNLNFNLGGAGGSGGHGGQVQVNTAGTISAAGPSSVGVFAQSIGGGGGSGGQAIADGLNGVGSWNVSVSMGGSGNVGGNGGAVWVTNTPDVAPVSINVRNDSSIGILAQSLGGGGGKGGAAAATPGETALPIPIVGGLTTNQSLMFSIGGKSGAGGNGGEVAIYTGANIRADGAGTIGIMAQSVGGGGGVASTTAASGGLFNLGYGGSGGAGGNGGLIKLANFNITTTGSNANGILAQSIGGGGGAGSITNAGGGAVSISLEVGGQGGAGGNSGNVNVGCADEYTNWANCAGSVNTSGATAHGVLAQSISGGGGNTQVSKVNLSADIKSFNVNIKGNANNGNSGHVLVQDSAASRFDIRTSGAGAIGIVAQSLSGGGSNLQYDFDLSRITFNASKLVRPSNAAGGNNAGAEVNLSGSVVTTGANAHGIYMQSLSGAVTAFGTDGQRVLTGFDQFANGQIKVFTRPGSVINTQGRGAYGIAAVSNYASSTGQAQWLQLQGGISVTGQDAWGVNILNGDTSAAWNRNTDSRATVEVYASITGQANSAGGVAMQNYQGQNQLFIKPGASVQMQGRTGTGQCPSIGCLSVSMLSPVKNHLIIDGGGSISGGTARLIGGGENIVDIHGTLSGIPATDSQGAYTVYPNPALRVEGGVSTVTVSASGRINGGIEAPSGSGSISNRGSILGSINAPGMTYSNFGTHVLKVFGDGRYSDSVTASAINAPSGGKFKVELASLPNGNFTPVRLMTGRFGFTSDPMAPAGAGTQLTINYQTDSSGNNVAVLTNVRVGFMGAGLPPQLGAAIQVAEDQANSGVDDDNSSDLPTNPSDSVLYDLLLDMANEDDTSTLEALLTNFSLGYSDATLSLASAWYAANHMQSCGDYKVASTSAIEQGDCSWAKLAYDDMELGEGAQRGNSWGLNAGMQRQIRDHIYVGVSAGLANTDYANFGIARSEGHRFTLGGIAKYVNGNVFGAASVLGGFSRADGERAITVPGLESTAKSERETWILSTRLRGGYNFSLDQGFSITPSLELNVPVVRDSGYRERNGGEFNMEVLSSTNVVPDLYPAIQLSRQFNVSERSVRGWVEVGQRLRFGDDLNSRVRMPDGFAPEAVTSLDYDPGKTSTIWSTGLLIENGERLEVRVMYENESGSGVKSQSGSVKFAWNF